MNKCKAVIVEENGCVRGLYLVIDKSVTQIKLFQTMKPKNDLETGTSA